jgi:hypothetical protein
MPESPHPLPAPSRAVYLCTSLGVGAAYVRCLHAFSPPFPFSHPLTILPPCVIILPNLRLFLFPPLSSCSPSPSCLLCIRAPALEQCKACTRVLQNTCKRKHVHSAKHVHYAQHVHSAIHVCNTSLKNRKAACDGQHTTRAILIRVTALATGSRGAWPARQAGWRRSLSTARAASPA